MSIPAASRCQDYFPRTFSLTICPRTLFWDRRASVAAARIQYCSSYSASPALPDAGTPSPSFQARPVFADHSRIRLWPTTRPPGIDNRPPRTFAVLLCLFTHAVNVQCNISEIVPGTQKKVARNRSHFSNGRIVSPREPRDFALQRTAALNYGHVFSDTRLAIYASAHSIHRWPRPDRRRWLRDP